MLVGQLADAISGDAEQFADLPGQEQVFFHLRQREQALTICQLRDMAEQRLFAGVAQVRQVLQGQLSELDSGVIGHWLLGARVYSMPIVPVLPQRVITFILELFNLLPSLKILHARGLQRAEPPRKLPEWDANRLLLATRRRGCYDSNTIPTL
ncbi:hypothetical protein D3C76_965320 [compost metagenome]